MGMRTFYISSSFVCVINKNLKVYNKIKNSLLAKQFPAIKTTKCSVTTYFKCEKLSQAKES